MKAICLGTVGAVCQSATSPASEAVSSTLPATLWLEKSVSIFLRNNSLPDTPFPALSFWFHIPIFIYHLPPCSLTYGWSISYGTTCCLCVPRNSRDGATERAIRAITVIARCFCLLRSTLWKLNSSSTGWQDGHDLVEFQEKKRNSCMLFLLFHCQNIQPIRPRVPMGSSKVVLSLKVRSQLESDDDGLAGQLEISLRNLPSCSPALLYESRV